MKNSPTLGSKTICALAKAARKNKDVRAALDRGDMQTALKLAETWRVAYTWE